MLSNNKNEASGMCTPCMSESAFVDKLTRAYDLTEQKYGLPSDTKAASHRTMSANN